MAHVAKSADGGAVTYQAASGGGDTADPGNRIHVRNGGVSSITVTITAFGACNQGHLHDLTYTVGNGTDVIIAAPSSDVYRSPTDGLIHIGYSGTSSVTVGVFG